MPPSAVPALFVGLVDDAAALRSGGAPVERALAEHRRHRESAYGDLLGPPIVAASSVPDLVRWRTHDPGPPDAPGFGVPGFDVAVLGDTGIARLTDAVEALAAAGITVRRVEAAVAKRGQDPAPGLDDLLRVLPEGIDGFAEIPLTWGLTEALDRLAEARAAGRSVAAKFRTGGLAAELYPTPGDLAGVLVACHERAVPFTLTAGLHRALRHNDPETGFTHHGFLNVLAACLAAAGGAPIAAVAERLAATDAVPLIELARAHRDEHRPLWTSFSCSAIEEPLADLRAFSLLG